MKKCKFITIILLLLTGFTFAQQIIGFGGLGGYIDTGFEKSGYYSINGGLGYSFNTFLKPEVKLEYFGGVIPDIGLEYNSNNDYTKFLNRTVSAFTITFSPTVSFRANDATVHFQIIPMYNYTQSYAKGSVLTLNSDKTFFVKTDEDSNKAIRHSLGVGIALLLDVNDDTFQAIAVEINYNNIEISDALSGLKFDKSVPFTNQSLGMRIKYYFGITKKKRKK